VRDRRVECGLQHSKCSGTQVRVVESMRYSKWSGETRRCLNFP
jgi:hypothetical protein